jgi:hypothetical protein
MQRVVGSVPPMLDEEQRCPEAGRQACEDLGHCGHAAQRPREDDEIKADEGRHLAPAGHPDDDTPLCTEAHTYAVPALYNGKAAPRRSPQWPGPRYSA